MDGGLRQPLTPRHGHPQLVSQRHQRHFPRPQLFASPHPQSPLHPAHHSLRLSPLQHHHHDHLPPPTPRRPPPNLCANLLSSPNRNSRHLPHPPTTRLSILLMTRKPSNSSKHRSKSSATPDETSPAPFDPSLSSLLHPSSPPPPPLPHLPINSNSNPSFSPTPPQPISRTSVSRPKRCGPTASGRRARFFPPNRRTPSFATSKPRYPLRRGAREVGGLATREGNTRR